MLQTFLLPLLRLLFLQNKQAYVRLRYDVGRELVVILSSATLLGLFVYMFHDFLHAKLQDLSPDLRARLSFQLLAALTILVGAAASGALRGLWQKGPSWISFASRIGQREAVLSAFRVLQTLFILGLYYGFFFALIVPRFTFNGNLAPYVLLGLGLGALRLVFFTPRDGTEEGKQSGELRPILSDRLMARSHTLLLWRWHQLIRRNRMARLCLALCLGFVALAAALIILGWPFFLTILVVMSASLLVACSLAFQLEEDMRSAWFERQIGCSHEEFVAVYQQLCYGIGGVFGLILLLLVAILRDPSQLAWSEAWKIMPIAALFPSLLPAVMFQLAPERPFLQILVTALIGLFLATAIFAHAGSLFLLPVLTYYAMQYQQNNFYRS